MSNIDLQALIPNNVHLGENRQLQRALEHWQPAFLNWWDEMGPSDFKAKEVYLRTALGVDASGWASYGYTPMPDYRWGIFLADKEEGRNIGFGDYKGQDVWQEVPGEYRSTFRRLNVTQGDTEPASVEQQRPGWATPRPVCMTCVICFKSTLKKAATCGRWCICCTPTLAVMAAKKLKSC